MIPRAKRSAVEIDATGAITVRVSVPPEDGRANDAVRELLAEHFNVRRSAVIHANRNQTVWLLLMANDTAKNPWILDTTDATGAAPPGRHPIRLIRWVSKSASAGDDVVILDEHGRSLFTSCASGSNFIDQAPIGQFATTLTWTVDSGTVWIFFDNNPKVF